MWQAGKNCSGKNKQNKVNAEYDKSKMDNLFLCLFIRTETPDGYQASDTKSVKPCHILKTKIGISISKVKPGGKTGYYTGRNDCISNLTEAAGTF